MARSGWKHTEEARRKMSESRRGRPRSEDTKKKISLGNARTKAAQRGTFPSEKRCSKCKKKRPLAEFGWRRRKLRYSEIIEPQPRCKICERKRMREYRQKQSQERRRDYDRMYRQRHKKRTKAEQNKRLPLLPEFIDWYYELKESKRLEFTRHTRAETASDTLREDGGSSVSILRGVFDRERWADYVGLSSVSALDNFERKLRRRDETITLELLDKVLHAVGHEHLLAQWWDMT